MKLMESQPPRCRHTGRGLTIREVPSLFLGARRGRCVVCSWDFIFCATCGRYVGTNKYQDHKAGHESALAAATVAVAPPTLRPPSPSTTLTTTRKRLRRRRSKQRACLLLLLLLLRLLLLHAAATSHLFMVRVHIVRPACAACLYGCGGNAWQVVGRCQRVFTYWAPCRWLGSVLSCLPFAPRWPLWVRRGTPTCVSIVCSLPDVHLVMVGCLCLRLACMASPPASNAQETGAASTMELLRHSDNLRSLDLSGG